MCEFKISMFQLCRQVGMLIAIAYVSNYRSMSDLKCKQIHLKLMQYLCFSGDLHSPSIR